MKNLNVDDEENKENDKESLNENNLIEDIKDQSNIADLSNKNENNK